MKRFIPILLIVLLPGIILVRSSGFNNTKSVVVSTSMLECAAREIMPASENIGITSILPPSSCPGHFDLSPRIIPILHSSVMVIRHDYQEMLEQKLEQLGAKNISFISVPSTGTPLIPSNYCSLVEEIGALYETFLTNRSEVISNSEKAVKSRTDMLTEKLKIRAVPWKGKPVIAATHQKEFCEWLGFEVVGELKRPEEMSIRDFEKLVALKVEMIVANLQEGIQGAVSLGERMDIPVAVLSNFPGADGFGNNYYDLIEENVRRLEEAWQKR